jgi:hypothetical protein
MPRDVRAIRIDGTMVRKVLEDGRHLVEITQEARNQDGELSVVGGGIVELPSRAWEKLARTSKGSL